MKIFPHELPPTLNRGPRPWAFSRSIIDPAAMMLAYAVAAMAVKGSFTQGDVINVLVIAMLSYPGCIPFNRMTREIAVQIVLNWVVAALVLLALGNLLTFSFPTEPPLVNMHVALAWTIISLFALLSIHAISPFVAPYLRPLYRPDNVLIVGVSDVALRLSRLIAIGEAEGQRLVGFVDDRASDRVNTHGPVTLLGTFAQLGEVTKTHAIGAIYMCIPMSSQPRVSDLLDQLRDTTASIYFIPDVFVADMIQGRVDNLGGLPIVSVCDTPFRGTAGNAKRAFDLLVVFSVLPVALPLLTVIAVLIKLTSDGPAIFRQRRFGLDGHEIVVRKFRTMSVMEDGDSVYTQVTRDDDRITPIGRFLRKTSLDELPQILNVLEGTMSLVGPRPHAIAVNQQFRKLIPGYMVRHKVKPGITGWAQVNGYRGGDDLESMRGRTRFDLEYLRSWSLALDLVILLKTAALLIRGDKKAY